MVALSLLPLLAGVAWADPVALRVGPPPRPAAPPITRWAPDPGTEVIISGGGRRSSPVLGGVVVLGWPESSAALRLSEGWGVALSSRLSSGATEVAVGRRVRSSGETQGVEAGLAVGAVGIPLDASLALSVTPHLRRWQAVGQAEVAIGLALPGVVRLTGGPEVRLPVLAELSQGGAVGEKVWLGWYTSGGVVLSPGTGGWALAGQLGLIATFPR